MLGQARGEVGIAHDGHAVLHDRLTGFGQLTVTALLCGHIHDYAAGLHGPHHLGGDELWRGLAGDQRSGDDDVHLTRLLGVHGALCSLEAFGHNLGVTAAAGTFFFVVHFDKLTAQ